VDVIIDPSWSFAEAFLVALQAYPGDNIGVKGYRNWVLKAWASTVGRERAVRGIAEFRANYRSKRAAAAALDLSADTFRRLETHFAKVRELVSPGLTLTFDSRLHRFDATAFDAFIASVLGPDTDVTIEQRSNIDAEGPSFIRINGARSEDLVAVAEAFYNRAWREAEAEKRALQKAMSAGIGVLLQRLDQQRDSLAGIEEAVGILDNPDVREKLGDDGAAFVLAKDKKLLQTRFQRISKGIFGEVRKRALGKAGDAVAGELTEITSELLVGDSDSDGA
jgi:hypothetical protein